MRNLLRASLFGVIVTLALGCVVEAQTTIPTTTLSAAVQTNSTAIQVTSTSGFQVGYYAYIDDELMLITGIQSLTVGVNRRQLGTNKEAHIQGATIYVAARNAFWTTDPSTSACLLNLEQYNVRINVYSGVIWSCSSNVWITLSRVGGNGISSGGSGSGSVTSVNVTVPAVLTAAGGPITGSGVIAIDTATETANTALAGPTSGGAAQPTFRSLVNADITSLAWSKLTGTPTTFSGYGISDSFTNLLTAATATRQGNTAKVVAYAGSAPATNDCAKYDASGNITTSGSACGAGGGGDFFTNTSTTATGEMILFADTGGKLGGRSFFALSGPATTIKTFVFPNASSTVLTSASAVTVAQGGTGLASGTSGGVPYYSGSTTLASSAALTANLPIVGGGAGVAPVSGTRSGNTTKFVTTTGTLTSGDCVKIDSSGNFIANGSACGSGSGGTGDVVGPASAVTTDFACFSGTTGKLLADCGAKLSDFYTITDPNADRILFWDDSAGSLAFLSLAGTCSITGTVLTCTAPEPLALQAKVAALEARLAQLEQRLAELEAQKSASIRK